MHLHPPDTGPHLVGVAPAIKSSFRAWIEHWQGCAMCGPLDWFEPGAPLILTEPTPIDRRLFGENKIVLKPEQYAAFGGKKVVFYRNIADPSLMCYEGHRLHSRWVREATLHEFGGQT